ncbi:LysR family transcriptional regulator [Paraburkholderia lycopersici]|uniref:DNA-binding transcriptional regulator, LysR family n=1 Tax=Paraburkholderia lycopersici TaxID=416944 RepID=A0A1G6SCZ4_9BURK|nr:LysR family transcriptional regulator [Paraburkholderia lycopersici]SDD14076.1 DNA-binding transcriptional regulator, LysR family [Paraburkholderia lycopersici]
MDTLQNMRAFVCVVESGSFTAAARSLGSTTGAISRAVSELEAHLRTRLLNRSTRHLGLTETGERYKIRCEKILADVNSAEEEASFARERPMGVLRMHSFASLGKQYVLPALSIYRTLYPEVTIELTLSQDMPDLFEGTSDVSVVTAPALPNSDMVSHQLGSVCSILCASPAYVNAHGAPRKPSDLLRHNCLILKTPSERGNCWALEGPDGSIEMRVDGPVKINMAESLAMAIGEGMGIGVLPVYAAIEGLQNGTLERVLPQYVLQRSNVYALYPSRKFVDAKTRTWVDFLRAHLPQFIERDMDLLDEITPAPVGRS